MKKNNLLYFFLVAIFLIITSSIISKVNIDKQEADSSKVRIFEYQKTANDYFDGTNYQETEIYMQSINKDLRMQFLNFSGEIEYSSIDLSYQLQSTDVKKQMDVFKTNIDDLTYVYSSITDDNHYLRIIIPFDNKHNIFMNVIAINSILIVLSFAVLFFIVNRNNLLQYRVIGDNISKLYRVINKNNMQTNSIEEIDSSLIELNSLLISKKMEIHNERIKSNVIINNINRGIVVIGNDGNILLVNNYARDLFNGSDDNLSKNYIYLFRNIKIQEGIEEALSNKKYISREIKIGARYYYYNIHDLNYIWEDRSTFVLLISEISDTRNAEIMKREFFANASHELKSPLTTIIGYQQMISEGLLVSKEDILDASTRTLKEARRMNKILTEMLELSKLESRNEVNIEEVNISNVISEILESKVEDLKKKSIEMKLELSDLRVMMNYNHAHQLFNNLIDNAIKYNKDNGKVTISMDISRRTVSVIDTGIGIKEENLDRIYERFYRVDKARSKDVGGTGLGLAIVKHVCSVYNFAIDTTSQINVGTNITIHLK